MGDMRIVRGGRTGEVRTMELTANGAIEKGDLLTITAGEFVKVADNAAQVAAVALGDAADNASCLAARLQAGTIVEGADLSTTDIVVGDQVGIDVTAGVIKFDVGAANKTFKCVKVVTAGSLVQCEVLDSVIG